MHRDEKIALLQAQHQAQQLADQHNAVVHVVKLDGTFQALFRETLDSGDEILHTAYPTIYERLTPNSGISYNRHEIKLTTIRKLMDDDGKEIEMERLVDLWDVEYARKVQAFLNKVL
jgi:hypothetical protein